MEFRRSGQRDERRRRVLIDETGVDTSRRAPVDSSGGGPRTAGRADTIRSYTDAALSPQQPRVVDLIPARWWTILVLGSLVLSCAAGLVALYGYVALGHTRIDVAHVPALDLAAPGSIASWLGSCLLLASAALGILTCQIRRHRVDDYRGRYRMWYWMVAVLVVASLDQVSDLQLSLRTALLHVAGIPEYRDAMLVWYASTAVIVGAILIRLAIEMRACRLAVAGLVLAGACYAAAAAARLDWLWSDAGVFRVMVLAALILGGHIALFLAVCLYARYVFRDARGQVARRLKKRRRNADTQSDDIGHEVSSPPKRRTTGSPSVGPVKDRKIRQDRVSTSHENDDSGSVNRPKSPGRRGKLRTVAAAEVAAVESDKTIRNDESASDSEEPRKLSKAERRRLRKQRRRERQ